MTLRIANTIVLATTLMTSTLSLAGPKQDPSLSNDGKNQMRTYVHVKTSPGKGKSGGRFQQTTRTHTSPQGSSSQKSPQKSQQASPAQGSPGSRPGPSVPATVIPANATGPIFVGPAPLTPIDHATQAYQIAFQREQANRTEFERLDTLPTQTFADRAKKGVLSSQLPALVLATQKAQQALELLKKPKKESPIKPIERPAQKSPSQEELELKLREQKLQEEELKASQLAAAETELAKLQNGLEALRKLKDIANTAMAQAVEALTITSEVFARASELLTDEPETIASANADVIAAQVEKEAVEKDLLEISEHVLQFEQAMTERQALIENLSQN